MRYKLEWRPTLNNNGTGYIRYSIDMNDDGVFTANELRVNLKGPNGYWVTTLQDANGNDIKDAAGNPKWRYIIPTDPKDRAGELKMGLYDFDSKINSTGMTLYTSAPVLRRIN
jgi:hypothetical protein